ncbi:HAMP domain-containing protein (plasmid) [Shewanella sp. LC6]|uniref:ATP-binding protein n=1 Tax=unclassified Shewanella TaxID=196818 RepID=UPI00112791D5|nr:MULTISPECIES: ATP-binding protein [unclassified Shewanella]QQK62436.1 HAMP domain-containing protein [Shewanella sp. LC6]TPE60649.1 HAMP domain-containing protein [Shewanella sp. LC2]
MPFDNKHKFNSLGIKVLLAFVTGVVLSIALSILVIFWVSVFHKNTLATLDVSDVAEKIGQTLQFNPEGNPVGLSIGHGELDWVFTSMQQDVAYRVLNSAGQTVISSVPVENVWQSENLTQPPEQGHNLAEVNGISYHNVTAAVINNGRTWYLQITVSERFYAFVHHAFSVPFMMIGIVLFSVVLLFIFGACTWITLRYTLKPLRELSDSATAISPRTLKERLSTEGIPTEISPLVDSFNHALDRLENGYRIQQEFMATAAHELKTPLALIRAQIELKEPSEDRDVLLNDVAHMTRHVQQLLMLAEVSEEQNYILAECHIVTVVEEVCSFLQPMAKQAEVKLAVTQSVDSSWEADRSALFVLLKNLLENAIQHAPKHTEVLIHMDTAEITIRDFGLGATGEQLKHIFERFWRGPHRRDHGAGLGLTICKEIAQAHGWELKAERAEPGLAFILNRYSAK